MGRTFLRQSEQIRNTTSYAANIAPTLANYQTNPTNLEEDLNNLRSQINNFLNKQTGNWYSDLNTVNGKKRALNDLNTDLDDVEEKRILFRVFNLADILVPTGQNYVVLGVGEIPGITTAAVGAVTTLGTVVAYYASFPGHSMNLVTGSDALHPKNLCIITDAITGDPILSSGRVVFALLQYETATDGTTITAVSPNRVQLSFVRHDATGDALEAVPFADVEGKTIHYAYVRRINFDAIPESAFLTGAFVDTAGTVTVTRQSAYDNQGTTPVELANNALLDIAAGKYWELRDSANADLFKLTDGVSGSNTTLLIGADVDVLDINAIDNDFAQGVSVASTKTRPIDIGQNDGVVETTAGALNVKGFTDLSFDDGNRTGSTYSAPVKLAASLAEWSAFEAAFGAELSLLAAITAARNGRGKTKVYANVTATATAGTDVGGVGGGANLDAQLPAMNGGTFLTDYDVFVNGELMRPAAGVGVNDYYPGTSLANGQLKFDFVLRVNDVICVIPWA